MLDASEFDDLVAVAHAGSLSAGAKKRGLAIATMARRIDALEAKTGLRLLDRRTDAGRLTAEGLQIAVLAEPLVEQVARVAHAVEVLRSGGAKAMPVRVSAIEFLISDVLAPALPALWKHGLKFPVQLQSQSEVVSLEGGDTDLAIRMVRPKGKSLVARKLGEMRLGFYASPAYLAGRDPAALDLKRERLLTYDDSYGRLPEIDWLAAQDLTAAVAMSTGSTRALHVAARRGAGIAILAQAFGDRDPGLLAIPQGQSLPSREPWLIVHRDFRAEPNIRAVQRWIVAAFASLLRDSPLQSGVVGG